MLIAVDEMRLQIADVLMQLQLIITRVKICIETLDEYSLEDSKVKVLLEFDSGHWHLNMWIISLHSFHFMKGSFRVLFYFDMFWEICMH